jgi:hypothetical protein
VEKPVSDGSTRDELGTSSIDSRCEADAEVLLLIVDKHVPRRKLVNGDLQISIDTLDLIAGYIVPASAYHQLPDAGGEAVHGQQTAIGEMCR